MQIMRCKDQRSVILCQLSIDLANIYKATLKCMQIAHKNSLERVKDHGFLFRCKVIQIKCFVSPHPTSRESGSVGRAKKKRKEMKHKAEGAWVARKLTDSLLLFKYYFLHCQSL